MHRPSQPIAQHDCEFISTKAGRRWCLLTASIFIKVW
jgi:hypothetical protein